jgi:mannose-6-phosphate isomerase-like protein (cupin superfamily)
MSERVAQLFEPPHVQWQVVDVRGTPMKEARVMNGEHGIYSAYYQLPKGTEIRVHRHAAWVQVMVVQGVMAVTEGEHRFLVRAGSCYFVPPGGRHHERSMEDTLVLVTSPDP